MTSILHATWLPQRKSLFVWGEHPELPERKSRKRKKPPHPYQTPAETLRGRLRGTAYTDPLLMDADQLTEETVTVWLPTIKNMPVPSPEMSETGAIPPPEGEPQLSAWQVTGLLLPINPAIDLLLALAKVRDRASDVHAWHLAALLAMEMVADQQVLPALEREGFQLRAGWRPRPTPAMAEQLTTLARSLPPLCRAVVEDAEQALTPRMLLNDFLETAIDATIRTIPFAPSYDASTPGGKWLEALLEDDPIVQLKGTEADKLFASWQEWAGQGQMAGNEAFRITFRLEPPERQEDPWYVSYLLQATDDPSLIVPGTNIWREQGDAFTYLERRFDQPHERMLKGLGHASRIFPPLEASLRSAAPDRAQLTLPQAFTFLKEAAPMLEQEGYGVLVPSWWGKGSPLKARAKAKSKGPSKTNEQAALSLQKIIQFTWHLSLGDEPLDFAAFEKLVALKMPLVQMRGQWVALDPESSERMLKLLKQSSGKMSFAEMLRLDMGNLGADLPEGVEFEGVEAEGWVAEALEGLRNTQKLDMLPQPEALHATLRPYQVRGYSWLDFMRRYGLGACLADDMGLGKTIQTIALILREHEQNNTTAPALLVCPTSVIGNWQREIQRFAPALRTMVHQGADRRQGKSFHSVLQDYEVVLTSYPLLNRDRDTLDGVEWSIVVLDEAQNIKNPSAKQTQAARALTATTRIALTGTPVENRLTELWSIMTFLNPGYLGSEDSFKKQFARPIERTNDPQATEQLKQLTSPFILRRLKTDKTIISDLPEKIEMNVYCTLTQEQATLYQATVEEGFSLVKEAESENDQMKRRGMVLSLLMKLKQICNHPAQFLKDGSSLEGRSGKIERLTEMLEEIHAIGDRALIFTQFSEMGHMLQRYLSERFYEAVLFLHGETPAKQRDAMVRQFQAPRGPTVFILSLKAGGTGLNLTNANHVFHFDRWWNPAVENQATDRAFRIGQTRNVQVHKFVCSGTLEDHINDLIEHKRSLAESVLGTGESWLTELSTDQLHDLITLKQTA